MKDNPPIGNRTALNIALWICQILVCAFFVFSGYVKLFTPVEKLATTFPWMGQVSPGFLYFTAVVDAAGGIGVLLPALTRILPRITVLAAAGCIALQIAAMIFHTTRGELGALPVNFVFVALSAFILWGRWKAVPLSSRSAA